MGKTATTPETGLTPPRPPGPEHPRRRCPTDGSSRPTLGNENAANEDPVTPRLAINYSAPVPGTGRRRPWAILRGRSRADCFSNTLPGPHDAIHL